MDLIYKKATLEDLSVLTKMRIEVLRSANNLDISFDMSKVKEQSYDYFIKALSDESHVAYLVFHNNIVIGTGGVSFFRVMPTVSNPTGNKAYIMNMYTNPGYRRQGIAFKVLDLLIFATKSISITSITLESTDMGLPLYKKYGFIQLKTEMQLPE